MARVTVKALIDSGATILCCSRRWYRWYHVEVGPLIQDQTQVIEVENTPIFVDGRTARPPMEWKYAVTTEILFCSAYSDRTRCHPLDGSDAEIGGGRTYSVGLSYSASGNMVSSCSEISCVSSQESLPREEQECSI